jgi:hypothetical protein
MGSVHTQFKESTFNYVITSSIWRRRLWEGKGFQPLKGEKGNISALYGDCFISGKPILIWDGIASPDY